MNSRLRFGLLTVTTLIAVAATLSLGRWQLSRADQKEAIRSRMEQQAALAPLNGQFLATLADPVSVLQRRVVIRGRWEPKHIVFLDNRQMNAKSGFYVLTPLRLEENDRVVLVQRGWVGRDFMDRTHVPAVSTPDGLVQIQGRIVPPPSKLYEFTGPDTGSVRQNLDIAAFSAETGLTLPLWSVQQTDPDGDGLLRQWPQVATGVDKHYGYAFQWFALSSLIFILYVWFQIVRRFIHSRRT